MLTGFKTSKSLKLPLLLGLSAVSGLLAAPQAYAQAYTQAAPVSSRVSAAAKLKGRPLFWADGITSAADLGDYKDVGLNTVVVRLSWTPSPTGEFSASDLVPQREFAFAAAKRGLRVVYSLPAAPTGFERALHLAADSPSYQALWTAWMASAVAALSDTPNLLGWMLPDDPRSLPMFDDLGFQHWVARNYATIQILNTQWGANFSDLNDVSINDVQALVAQWHPERQKSNVVATQQMVSATSPIDPNQPFHPAALALAAYKWDAYRDLMKLWANGLREADAGRHLVFSGRLPDYAQLLSQPDGVDVILPDIQPSIVENDVVTHNPQSIDIARRSGKFGALPMFSVREGGLIPQAALTTLVGRWISTARSRGAVGAGFDSWPALKRNTQLMSALAQDLAFLTRGRELNQWGDSPHCTTAVLLTPLADGTVVKAGPASNQVERGLYGFGDDMVPGEPSTLVWSLRWGTAFGGVDYLSPDDLDKSLASRYTTILAPQLLSCPANVTTNLSSYVFDGGTLITDLGLGAVQSGGRASSIPPQMANLFGVPGVYELHNSSFNLLSANTHPMFQAWNRVIANHDNTMLTVGEMPGSKAFSGSVGYSAEPPVAQSLAYGPQIIQNFAAAKRALRVPLTINDAGRGYAIFAPFQLWSSWRPGNVGFNDFHGDLWARGATLALGTDALVPSPALTPDGQTRFPEVDDREDSITLTNHDAPGQITKFSRIDTTGTGDWLWSNTIVLLSNEVQSLLGTSRPTPVGNVSEFDSRPRPIALYSALEPGDNKVLQMVPIAVQNLGGGTMSAQVEKDQTSEVLVDMWPNTTSLNPGERAWQPSIGAAATCRFTMYPSQDGYVLTPGSSHRVVVTDYARPEKKGFHTEEYIVKADALGRISFEFIGAACRVRITSATIPMTATEDTSSVPAAFAVPAPATPVPKATKKPKGKTKPPSAPTPSEPEPTFTIGEPVVIPTEPLVQGTSPFMPPTSIPPQNPVGTGTINVNE